MLASLPASMLNQSRPDSGIPNRINLTPSRSKGCCSQLLFALVPSPRKQPVNILTSVKVSLDILRHCLSL
jgi:hypothetical protein